MTTRLALIVVRDSAVADALELSLGAFGLAVRIAPPEALDEAVLEDDTILVVDERLVRPAARWVESRRLRGWRGPVVLLVEGSGSEDLRQAPPPAAWLSKPFSAQELVEILGRIASSE